MEATGHTFLTGLDDAEREAISAAPARDASRAASGCCARALWGDGILLLRAGTVKVVAMRNGQPAVVALRGAGDVIGEFRDARRRAAVGQVIAVDDGEALEIDGETFRAALGDAPAARRRINAMLTTRLRESTDQVVDSSALDVTGRMAARVLELADRFESRRATARSSSTRRCRARSWPAGPAGRAAPAPAPSARCAPRAGSPRPAA